MNSQGQLGILVGGGPAPGINSAISAATIEARNAGVGVVGILDGFEHLIAGRTDMVRGLDIADVSRIHFQGGSILRTSRENPTRSEERLDRVIDTLLRLGVSHLMTIGGDDTAFAALSLSRRAGGRIRVAHVPKTIDNDLPLPYGMPTFGYESARHVGTELVLTMMEDSRTTNRWFVVVVMGRKAGHLALGLGKAAGATLTIIPEDFAPPRITLDDVCLVIEGAIIKRRLTGQQHGLVVVAEGVGERIDPRELKEYAGVEVSYDPYGHVTLADIPLGSLIRQRVQKRFAERGDPIRLADTSLGYTLRCTDPIPFDIDYTRTLGHGAVRFLLGSGRDAPAGDGGFICLDGDDLRVIPFDEIVDPETGRTRVRFVDITAPYYEVARSYMIRLQRSDLEDPEQLRRLAEAAKLSPGAFDETFGPLWKAAAVAQRGA